VQPMNSIPPMASEIHRTRSTSPIGASTIRFSATLGDRAILEPHLAADDGLAADHDPRCPRSPRRCSSTNSMLPFTASCLVVPGRKRDAPRAAARRAVLKPHRDRRRLRPSSVGYKYRRRSPRVVSETQFPHHDVHQLAPTPRRLEVNPRLRRRAQVSLQDGVLDEQVLRADERLIPCRLWSTHTTSLMTTFVFVHAPLRDAQVEFRRRRCRPGSKPRHLHIVATQNTQRMRHSAFCSPPRDSPPSTS